MLKKISIEDFFISGTTSPFINIFNVYPEFFKIKSKNIRLAHDNYEFYCLDYVYAFIQDEFNKIIKDNYENVFPGTDIFPNIEKYNFDSNIYNNDPEYKSYKESNDYGVYNNDVFKHKLFKERINIAEKLLEISKEKNFISNAEPIIINSKKYYKLKNLPFYVNFSEKFMLVNIIKSDYKGSCYIPYFSNKKCFCYIPEKDSEFKYMMHGLSGNKSCYYNNLTNNIKYYYNLNTLIHSINNNSLFGFKITDKIFNLDKYLEKNKDNKNYNKDDIDYLKQYETKFFLRFKIEAKDINDEFYDVIKENPIFKDKTKEEIKNEIQKKIDNGELIAQFDKRTKDFSIGCIKREKENGKLSEFFTSFNVVNNICKSGELGYKDPQGKRLISKYHINVLNEALSFSTLNVNKKQFEDYVQLDGELEQTLKNEKPEDYPIYYYSSDDFKNCKSEIVIPTQINNQKEVYNDILSITLNGVDSKNKIITRLKNMDNIIDNGIESNAKNLKFIFGDFFDYKEMEDFKIRIDYLNNNDFDNFTVYFNGKKYHFSDENIEIMKKNLLNDLIQYKFEKNVENITVAEYDFSKHTYNAYKEEKNISFFDLFHIDDDGYIKFNIDAYNWGADDFNIILKFNNEYVTLKENDILNIFDVKNISDIKEGMCRINEFFNKLNCLAIKKYLKCKMLHQFFNPNTLISDWDDKFIEIINGNLCQKDFYKNFFLSNMTKNGIHYHKNIKAKPIVNNIIFPLTYNKSSNYDKIFNNYKSSISLKANEYNKPSNYNQIYGWIDDKLSYYLKQIKEYIESFKDSYYVTLPKFKKLMKEYVLKNEGKELDKKEMKELIGELHTNSLDFLKKKLNEHNTALYTLKRAIKNANSSDAKVFKNSITNMKKKKEDIEKTIKRKEKAKEIINQLKNTKREYLDKILLLYEKFEKEIDDNLIVTENGNNIKYNDVNIISKFNFENNMKNKFSEFLNNLKKEIQIIDNNDKKLDKHADDITNNIVVDNNNGKSDTHINKNIVIPKKDEKKKLDKNQNKEKKRNIINNIKHTENIKYQKISKNNNINNNNTLKVVNNRTKLLKNLKNVNNKKNILESKYKHQVKYREYNVEDLMKRRLKYSNEIRNKII